MPSSPASRTPLPFQSRKSVSPIAPAPTVIQASEPVVNGVPFWTEV